MAEMIQGENRAVLSGMIGMAAVYREAVACEHCQRCLGSNKAKYFMYFLSRTTTEVSRWSIVQHNLTAPKF